MPVLYSYRHPDGGWRQVEIMHVNDGLAKVRDWHRGESYWVPNDSLSPVEKYEGPQPQSKET